MPQIMKTDPFKTGRFARDLQAFTKTFACSSRGPAVATGKARSNRAPVAGMHFTQKRCQAAD
jgi:hypothetical protein